MDRDPFARMGLDEPAPAQPRLPLPQEHICCVCHRRVTEIHRVPLGPRQPAFGNRRGLVGVCGSCAPLRRCDLCEGTCALDELGPIPGVEGVACDRCRAWHCGTCGVELSAEDVELGLDVCEACAFSPGCHERAPATDAERVAALPGGGR